MISNRKKLQQVSNGIGMMLASIVVLLVYVLSWAIAPLATTLNSPELANFVFWVQLRLALPILITSGVLAVIGPCLCLSVPREVRGTGYVLVAICVSVLGLFIQALSYLLQFPFWVSVLTATLSFATIFCYTLFAKKLASFLERDDIRKLAQSVLVLGAVAGVMAIVQTAAAGVVTWLVRGLGMGGAILEIVLPVVMLIVMILASLRYVRLLIYLRRALSDVPQRQANHSSRFSKYGTASVFGLLAGLLAGVIFILEQVSDVSLGISLAAGSVLGAAGSCLLTWILAATSKIWMNKPFGFGAFGVVVGAASGLALMPALGWSVGIEIALTLIGGLLGVVCGVRLAANTNHEPSNGSDVGSMNKRFSFGILAVIAGIILLLGFGVYAWQFGIPSFAADRARPRWDALHEPTRDPVRPDDTELAERVIDDYEERDSEGKLISIALYGQELTLADLASLPEAKTIRRVYAGHTDVTDADLAFVSALDGLELLELNVNSNITDAGLKHLEGLHKLKMLSLFNCSQLNGEGLEHLGALDNLTILDLGNNGRIKDENLGHLKELDKLQTLRMRAVWSVTDDGLKHLAELRALRRLSIESMRITDQGVGHLTTLTNLESLDLEGCKLLTNPGVERLRTALPDCKIVASPHTKAIRVPSIPGLGTEIISPTTAWKWLHPTDGVDPSANEPAFHSSFATIEYDDSIWSTGEDRPGTDGGFGYGDPIGVDIGKPESGNRKTAYFRHAFETTELYAGLVLELQRDDGIIVYLDGKEVLRDNVPAGPDRYDLMASRFFDPETEAATFHLPVPLEIGKHVLAISLHNVAQSGVASSSDLRIGEISLQGIPPLSGF